LALTALAMFTGAIQSEIAWICIILLIVVNLGYGGGFSNLPTLLSDVYGMDKISSIHGIALSAWAMAGLTGNQVASIIVKNSASEIVGFQNILYFTLALYAVALIIDFVLIRNKKSKKEENN
jgi:OFA family oxalate/formate antiporter-like MFS transporter